MSATTAAPAAAASLSPDRIEQTWESYRTDPDGPAKDQLIRLHLPLIHKVVRRLKTRLPLEVDSDDLVQEGVFGLMHAIAGFNPDLNVKFETFAAMRIRGAVLDYLRSIDWKPRGARERSKAYEAARRRHQMETGQNPTEEEIRDRLGIGPELFERYRRAARMSRPVSLDACAAHGDDDGGGVVHTLPDSRQPSPISVAQRRDLRRAITRELAPNERLIFLLYYYERMTMKEVGLTLRISESRVSQILTAVRDRLRERLSAGRINLAA